MPSHKDLEQFTQRCHDLMTSIGCEDWSLLRKEYGDVLPEGLDKHCSMMGVFVMVGVGMARLEYSDTVITKELSTLRLLYDQSQKEGYNAAFALLERCYKDSVINKEKRERLQKKLEEMEQVIFRCRSIPSRRRCLCIEMECLVPYCGRGVAGHGYLVCDRHHDAYCNSGFRGGLLDWSISKL